MEHSRLSNLTGATIRKLRNERNLTAQQLADKCEVLTYGLQLTRSALAKIEAGIRPINDKELLAIATVLKVEIADLFPKNARALLKKILPRDR